MTAEQARLLRRAPSASAIAVDYSGAARAEFLFSRLARTFAFLEVNTASRSSTDHRVTTDTDLVKSRSRRGGGRLGAKPTERGYAVEARSTLPDGLLARPAASPIWTSSRPRVLVDAGGEGDR